MNRRFTFASLILATIGSASLAFAQQGHEQHNQDQPAVNQPAEGMPPLPPGWTQEDFQACMVAGTPGEMHEFLAEGVGVWDGKSKMWMTPDMSEPLESECVSTIKSIMDGRYFICEMKGEMPGMGEYNGYGVYAFDNVSGKFQSSWIDNHSTGIMTGTGELSPDRKTLTWTYTYNCPITQKPTTLREVERFHGKNSTTLTMYGVDPISGKEFKMMEIALTRRNADDTAAAVETRR